jgi:hypothetical protein
MKTVDLYALVLNIIMKNNNNNDTLHIHFISRVYKLICVQNILEMFDRCENYFDFEHKSV